MSAVDLSAVSRTMKALLTNEVRAVIYRDHAEGRDHTITPASAASPSGLLPAFIVAGEAVWREATGQGFKLDIARDVDAMLGYRLRGIGAGTFTTVLLAAMEATAQVARPGAIVVNDLNAVWSAATDRIARDAAARDALLAIRATRGAAP